MTRTDPTIKLAVIVAVMAAVAGLIFGINRLSTQYHPMGNWIILVGVLLVLAAVGAWVWDSKTVYYYFSGEDEAGRGVYSWRDARTAVKKEKEKS